MTWTKLGDDFSHETRDLTDAEFRTHVDALVWSNWRTLDLVIPKRNLRRFGYSPDAESAAAGLVAKGWWEDRGDCWYVGLRFPEWQPKRDAIERRREATALCQRRNRMHKAGDYSIWGPSPDACELCGAGGVRIVWEHCHTHNQHRGWLCDGCNATLREVDKGFNTVRAWKQAGEEVWLYWLRCGQCAGRQTASPFALPSTTDGDGGGL